MDLEKIRHAHRNAIRNTATGKALGLALAEVERLRAISSKAAYLEGWVREMCEIEDIPLPSILREKP